jgi:hypothetical protein
MEGKSSAGKGSHGVDVDGPRCSPTLEDRVSCSSQRGLGGPADGGCGVVAHDVSSRKARLPPHSMVHGGRRSRFARRSSSTLSMQCMHLPDDMLTRSEQNYEDLCEIIRERSS